MPIIFDSEKKIFKLDTLNSSYIFKIYRENYLVHLYYGAKIPDYNLTDFEKRNMYASFSPSNCNMTDCDFSADTYPFEIGCNGAGDMRISALQIRGSSGCAATDVRYVSHKIYSGKRALEGLPAVKVHCSVLAEEAVKSALADYYKKIGRPIDFEIESDEHEDEE